MKKMYAEVIINQSNVNIDKLFVYGIPEVLIKNIKIGQRVIVPFGKGNKKLDAFIINLRDNCQINEKRLKFINQIVDQEPLLLKNQIKLAYWMKENYLCTYIEAIQPMIPTGLNLKVQRLIIPNKARISNGTDYSINNKLENEILRYLYGKTGKVYVEEIKKLFPHNNINKIIKNLQNKQYLFIKDYYSTKIKEKRQKYLSLSGKYQYKEDYIKEVRSNAHKQIQILKNLEDTPYNYNELKKELNFSSTTINSLVDKGLIKVTSQMMFRDPYTDIIFKNPKIPLTKEQDSIIKEFNILTKHSPNKFLIHGVTGSGKTEIYLNMIETMLKSNKQSILLVPEISLTPQMVERVIGRFGQQVSILHSGLSQGEKYDQWQKIKTGKINIVIGARSAIFAPLKNLGLIIIDEEHETSYKSSNKPRYHAREIAEKRCDIEGCHLVLGSATPSIESYYKGQNKQYHLFSIDNRVDNIPMPNVKMVDMRKELEEGNYSILSRELREELTSNLKNNQQSILFLNRRGFSTFVSCRQCGYVEKCHHCDVSLTYHYDNKKLMCHYCGYTKISPTSCPSCKSKKIKYIGTGTQKVEEIIKSEFPKAKILRMDVDTTRRKGGHDRILNAFKNQEADILIGTQMIAKGLDFPNVTLVGVIIADTSLNLPDFRAAERTFQLTTQVAGRAGRGALLGKVIVQTYEPDHYSLIHAKNHDYVSFYNNEINLRKEMQYPPFKEMINIIFTGDREDILIKKTNEFHRALNRQITNSGQNCLLEDMYKPVPSPISKINNKYRWNMIIKTQSSIKFKEILKDIHPKFTNQNKEINIAIDINPTSIL